MQITAIYNSPQQVNTITVEQYRKKREQRRRRVAKRQLKRFPLFAVEFMSKEFPMYDWDTFIEDVTRKTRKSKSFKSVKSPLKRQGRYMLFENAMSNYHLTKEQKYLEEAQYWRNRLFLRYEIIVKIGSEKEVWTFGSQVNYKFIENLHKKLKSEVPKGFTSQAEADIFYKENTQYSTTG